MNSYIILFVSLIIGFILSNMGVKPVSDFMNTNDLLPIVTANLWIDLAIIFIAMSGIIFTGKTLNSSNPALATIGAFLLWFGWFGFNGGSVLSADPGAVSLVFVTTAMGAAAGTIAAMILDRIISRHFNIMNALNGMLGGLVGVTAGADQFTVMNAIIVGALAGILVVTFLHLLNKMKIDDPVGAISVHLVAGIWGTLAVGIFGALASITQLASQLIGVVSVGLFTTATSFVIFFAIDKVMGLRVSEKAEIQGLDSYEHTSTQTVEINNSMAPVGGK